MKNFLSFDLDKMYNWSSLKIIAFAIMLIAIAAIITGIPYIICNGISI